jgi:hypothetical protein
MADRKKRKYQRRERDGLHTRKQVELQGYWQSHDIVLFFSNLSLKKECSSLHILYYFQSGDNLECP